MNNWFVVLFDGENCPKIVYQSSREQCNEYIEEQGPHLEGDQSFEKVYGGEFAKELV